MLGKSSSYGGSLVLIKSIVSSLSIYFMSLFAISLESEDHIREFQGTFHGKIQGKEERSIR